MQTEFLWNELLQILNQLQIEVRWARGEFRGGLYASRGIQRLLLNEEFPQEWQIKIICQELSRIDLSRFYLSPAVRDSIEIHRQSAETSPSRTGFSSEDGYEACFDQ